MSQDVDFDKNCTYQIVINYLDLLQCLVWWKTKFYFSHKYFFILCHTLSWQYLWHGWIYNRLAGNTETGRYIAQVLCTKKWSIFVNFLSEKIACCLFEWYPGQSPKISCVTPCLGNSYDMVEFTTGWQVIPKQAVHGISQNMVPRGHARKILLHGMVEPILWLSLVRNKDRGSHFQQEMCCGLHVSG